ncbi:hypothetical protein AA13595_1866 [Gluconacetobacter johannae DSM 13595]|uniref:Uncharacterized protein n=1 Tax=Gluconacetobacter johannae TaxID=112140 RepID=A0A7W4P4F8_9PROT|nr:hypothetical protein [Gluconacetobacter johannae]MBB2176879.1 hypothetical protein [Gluconacetobacter johannae]GBQ86311.1 hypothetical protein AA13595_1866 [Gluconacetobacter johannae DSM 13595]
MSPSDPSDSPKPAEPPVPDRVPPGVDPHKPAGPSPPPHEHEPPLEPDPYTRTEVRPERGG